jgi:aerobic carbon-monoxide dehydrogenase large subunit
VADDGPAVDAAAPSRRWVGRAIKRVEDGRFVTGRGRYVDDVRLPDTAHVALVRSPHAHAGVRGIETGRARGHPGVLAVVTGADLGGVKVMRSDAMEAEVCRSSDWSVLADGVVRYPGEAVAAVVARDRYAAQDGAALVEVTYEPRPAVTGIDDALREDAPRVHAGWPDNVLIRAAGGDPEAVARAFAQADVHLRETFESSPITAVPLEPRGCLAAVDHASGILTLWTSNQIPHVVRSLLAEHLGHPEHLLRVICPDMGGGFGIKTHFYPEDLLVAALALRLGRPVKWVQTRSEDLACNTYCRDHRLTVEIAATRDGRLVGMRAGVEMNGGAYAILPGFSSILEATGAARQVLGPYRIPVYAYEAVAVASHRTPRGAYRGVAMVTTTFAVERLMDRLAAETGIDPAEVRLRNLVTAGEFPYRNALGTTYEPASFVESLREGLRVAGYAELRAEQARLRAAGRHVGIGIATYAEFTSPNSKALAWRGIVRVPGFDSTTVRMDPSGKVRAYTSITAMGQGVETTFAQVIADEVGVAVSDVTVSAGDSTLAPYGSGAFASRGAVVGGGASILAARKVRDKLLAIAAHDLEAGVGDLQLADGAISVKGAPFRSVAVSEVARQAYMVSPRPLPDGIEPGLEGTTYYDPPLQTISNGTHLAMVEVDEETGTVRLLRHVVAHDCGTVINPMIVDGQIHGGTAQGLGQALAETAAYDEAGQLLTGTLMDYALPRADDMPLAFDITHLETPSPHTVAGIKGMGEGGTIGAVASVANAVADALAGARVTRLPLSPPRVRELARGRG